MYDTMYTAHAYIHRVQIEYPYLHDMQHYNY